MSKRVAIRAQRGSHNSNPTSEYQFSGHHKRYSQNLNSSLSFNENKESQPNEALIALEKYRSLMPDGSSKEQATIQNTMNRTALSSHFTQQEFQSIENIHTINIANPHHDLNLKRKIQRPTTAKHLDGHSLFSGTTLQEPTAKNPLNLNLQSSFSNTGSKTTKKTHFMKGPTTTKQSKEKSARPNSNIVSKAHKSRTNMTRLSTQQSNDAEKSSNSIFSSINFKKKAHVEKPVNEPKIMNEQIQIIELTEPEEEKYLAEEMVKITSHKKPSQTRFRKSKAQRPHTANRYKPSQNLTITTTLSPSNESGKIRRLHKSKSHSKGSVSRSTPTKLQKSDTEEPPAIKLKRIHVEKHKQHSLQEFMAEQNEKFMMNRIGHPNMEDSSMYSGSVAPEKHHQFCNSHLGISSLTKQANWTLHQNLDTIKQVQEEIEFLKLCEETNQSKLINVEQQKKISQINCEGKISNARKEIRHI